MSGAARCTLHHPANLKVLHDTNGVEGVLGGAIGARAPPLPVPFQAAFLRFTHIEMFHFFEMCSLFRPDGSVVLLHACGQ